MSSIAAGYGRFFKTFKMGSSAFTSLYQGYPPRAMQRIPNYCSKCWEHSSVVGNLHTHHIQAKVDGGGDEPENLISLCETCHKEWHSFTVRYSPSFDVWVGLPSGHVLALAILTGESVKNVEHETQRRYVVAYRNHQSRMFMEGRQWRKEH